MKGSTIGAILVGLASAVACKGDPMADLRGGAVSLTLTPSIMFIDNGASASLSSVARDAQLNPIDFVVGAESVNPAVATAVFDRILPNYTTSVFTVTGVGASADSTYIRVHGGALKDSVLVIIN
jgi:hypothetical protein